VRLRLALAQSGLAAPLPRGSVCAVATFAQEQAVFGVDSTTACLSPLGLSLGKTLGEGNFGKVAICTSTSDFAPRYDSDIALKIVAKPPLPAGGGGYDSEKGTARLVKCLRGEIVALEKLQKSGGHHGARNIFFHFWISFLLLLNS
tara:strand:- start:95 stop:532 length:438 start_codon:yes stop_codon:yes gene_type:complete